MSGFASYQIARSGLFASERALYITGHNISNVNTAGFSRQQVIIASAKPDNSGKFPVGLGATIEQVRQIRQTFLDNVYRSQVEQLGYQETKLKVNSDVESVLGEPMNEGIQSSLNDFWDSWQELSKAPESLTVRALVRQRASVFVNQVNHIGEQLNKLQSDINSEIGVRIEEINSLASKVADLNIRILNSESSGDLANDFRDQRAGYLDRLSKLINVSINERVDGMVDVDIGGHALVTNGDSVPIYAGENSPGSLYNAPRWKYTNNLVDVNGGIMKGLLEGRGEAVLGSIDSISNGTPNTKADITFAIDLADPASINSLNQVDAFGKTNLSKFIDRLENKGVDYRFNLVTFGGTPGADFPQQFADRTSFETAVSTLSTRAGTDNDFFGVVDRLENDITYRTDANRYLMTFTDQSIQGDATAPVGAAALQTQIDRLNQLGMTTFVSSNNAFLNDTNPEPGWQRIANDTGGKLYDISSVNYDSLALDIDGDVNEKISVNPASNGIIPDIKKKLNALINILAREVNSLHTTGRDMYGNLGLNFFVPADSTLPLQMGNIKINPAFAELNMIAAAKTASPGDNSLAQSILDIRANSLFGDSSKRVNGDEYYNTTILTLGNNGTEFNRVTEGQTQLLQATESQRTAISGVAMDEEMSNMMKFQYSYNAASKVINLMDELFDNIINKMGR